MDKLKKIDVSYHGRHVGTLGLLKTKEVAFEYSNEWLSEGFSISPFSLPLKKKLFISDQKPFDGLFGVFSDSLPDGWGRLLLDRLLVREGMDPSQTGSMERLAIIGNSGMGALTYKPTLKFNQNGHEISYDEIAQECERILHEEASKNLDYLFTVGGSSGGARPKILTKVDGEEWIIKFPSSEDGPEIGEQEYRYALCAKKCGISITEVRLFPSSRSKGYFGTKRFDRTGKGDMERIHMVSVSGLLETSHRFPNLDYDMLMKLTLQLTKDMEECKKLFRLMCFNVFAHNRDDHSKNFSFLYDEKNSRWTLSPAYDLTYSNSIGGEHATMVHGNGKNPGMQDILETAKSIGLDRTESKKIAEEIREIVQESLNQYLLRNTI